MTRRPDTSGATAILGEVVAVAPDATCAAARHGDSRAAYQAGCRCPGAVEANRAYYRDYNRTGRELAAWRERQNGHVRRYQRRLRSDPKTREELKAKRRQQAAARRARDRHDALHMIDDVVVLRLLDGQHVSHNRVERIEAVRQLRHHGLSYLQIAERLHVTERRVHRDLAGLGLIGQEAVA